MQLALKASQLLEHTKLSELRSAIARSLSELEMFTEDGENMDTPKRKSAINERMEDLVSAPLAVEDALVGLFDRSYSKLVLSSGSSVTLKYVHESFPPYDFPLIPFLYCLGAATGSHAESFDLAL